MLYFAMDLKCSCDMEAIIFKEDKDKLLLPLDKFNRRLEKYLEPGISLSVTAVKGSILKSLIAYSPLRISIDAIEENIKSIFNELYSANVEVSFEEITALEYLKYVKRIEEESDYLHLSHDRAVRKFKLDFFDNDSYTVKQDIIKERYLTKEDALHQVTSMIPDASMIEEIERIYAVDNPKNFLGHPIHYLIKEI